MSDTEALYFTGPGWWKMLDEKLESMYNIDPTLSGVQVKEKFGKARIDYDHYDPQRIEALNLHEEVLERISGETCELCGEHGTIRVDKGRVQCRCDRCQAATREERNQIMRKTAEEYGIDCGDKPDCFCG